MDRMCHLCCSNVHICRLDTSAHSDVHIVIYDEHGRYLVCNGSRFKSRKEVRYKLCQSENKIT